MSNTKLILGLLSNLTLKIIYGQRKENCIYFFDKKIFQKFKIIHTIFLTLIHTVFWYQETIDSLIIKQIKKPILSIFLIKFLIFQNYFI